jgi:hypothetical protein
MTQYLKSDHLIRERRHLTRLILYCYGGIVISTAATVLFIASYKAVLSALVVIIFCLWALDKYKNERASLAAGIAGEELLRKTLGSALSDDYAAFFNLKIKKVGEIDCFLIGPSGAYLFEVKHNSGEIIHNDGGWRQLKRRGRRVYIGRIGNPSGQLIGAVNKMRKYLRSNGIDLWIQGILVFTNPEANLTLETELKSVQTVRIHELGSVWSGRTDFPDKVKQRTEKLLRSV